MSRFERLSATTRRLSEEQVRSLTELFLLLGKQQKSPRSISTGHEIPLLNSEKQVASSPIRRSATLPSSSRGQYHRPDETGTIRTPANARRPPYVNTLERIDSMVDDDPPSDKRPARSTRAESSVPSPRALQRAKSTVSLGFFPVLLKRTLEC